MSAAPTSTAAAAAPRGLAARLARGAHEARWRALQRRFDQRALRERLLMTGAAVALMLLLADALWLGPALKDFRSARSQQAAAQAALAALQADADRLADQGQQQNRARQAELAAWRDRVRDGEAALRQHQDALVGPDRMVELLEHLLARHGAVRVRAMRSLGRSDLLAAAATGPAPTPAAAPGPGLYRHGVELELEGGFADLLAYLRAMEALPQRVLWGSVSLKVEQHPKSVLTLRVYTLSRERHWLEI